MELGEFLDSSEGVIGNPPDKNKLAAHIADLISAAEKNRANARLDGEVDMILEFNERIVDLRIIARQCGLDPNDYRGIFR